VQSQETVWRLDDLGLFLGSVLPCLLVASLVRNALAFQFVFEALLLGVLNMLARMRYDARFGDAVAWRLDHSIWWSLASAPILAIVVGRVGEWIGMPDLQDAVDRLADLDVPMYGILLLSVLFGPAFEEIVFRGFLQPLLQHALGVATGWFIASALFSLLHAIGNGWHWQPLLLLFLVGLVLGAVRMRTGSTLASFALHAGFNAMYMLARYVSGG
jgi:membrane protease YdiL (CAAX protease family)